LESFELTGVRGANASSVGGEVVLRGLPAAGGVAIGPAYLYVRDEVYVVERELGEDEAQEEIRLFREAITRAEQELHATIVAAESNLTEDATAIFESQMMILNDTEVQKAIERRILREKKTADFIIQDEFNRYKSLLITASETFRERLIDIDDICGRLIRNLQKKRLNISIEGQHIVIAENLTPVDTILFSAKDVLGYVTEYGGPTSHAAILARSFNIPAAAGVHKITSLVRTGDLVILDGQLGQVIVNPCPERIAQYREKIVKLEALSRRLGELAGLPSVTSDGHAVELSANAEFIEELEYIKSQGADGIGLYRTEHLYIDKGDFPSEQEQYFVYSEIAAAIHPRFIIIRTFDIGGDKFLLDDRKEENPFLGWRGSRVMLDKPDIFRQQLRAILRASVRKNLKIMFPMISGLQELREAIGHLNAAKQSLVEEGLAFDDDIEYGIMIEVPSAVIIADDLAKEVRFFSIGTNDLIQYLLAVDRNNDLISSLYQEFHPAVIRAIKHVVDTAHRNNIWVGMCGEMAGNPVATPLLLGLGLDEFSMVPSMLPEIKKIVRTTRFQDAAHIAAEALRLQTAEEIKRYMLEFSREHYPELYDLGQQGGGNENASGI